MVTFASAKLLIRYRENLGILRPALPLVKRLARQRRSALYPVVLADRRGRVVHQQYKRPCDGPMINTWEPMRDDVSPPARFLVRQGSKGWMVYDRQRKGPAVVGTSLAVNLTKQQAKGIEQVLMAERESKRSS
jgi:hypothetical protein